MSFIPLGSWYILWPKRAPEGSLKHLVLIFSSACGLKSLDLWLKILVHHLFLFLLAPDQEKEKSSSFGLKFLFAMSFFKTGLDYSQDEAGASGLKRPGLDYKNKAGSINSAVASSSVASSG